MRMQITLPQPSHHSKAGTDRYIRDGGGGGGGRGLRNREGNREGGGSSSAIACSQVNKVEKC